MMTDSRVSQKAVGPEGGPRAISKSSGDQLMHMAAPHGDGTSGLEMLLRGMRKRFECHSFSFTVQRRIGSRARV
jgi:hypothetical protein